MVVSFHLSSFMRISQICHFIHFIQYIHCHFSVKPSAVIAQLGERKTEDLKVSGSIPDCGKFFLFVPLLREINALLPKVI